MRAAEQGAQQRLAIRDFCGVSEPIVPRPSSSFCAPLGSLASLVVYLLIAVIARVVLPFDKHGSMKNAGTVVSPSLKAGMRLWEGFG